MSIDGQIIMLNRKICDDPVARLVLVAYLTGIIANSSISNQTLFFRVIDSLKEDSGDLQNLEDFHDLLSSLNSRQLRLMWEVMESYPLEQTH
jgi:hypothetical protein